MAVVREKEKEKEKEPTPWDVKETWDIETRTIVNRLNLYAMTHSLEQSMRMFELVRIEIARIRAMGADINPAIAHRHDESDAA